MMSGPEHAAAWRAKGHHLEACPFCGNPDAPKLLHRSEVADDLEPDRVHDAFAIVCDASICTTSGRGCGGASGYRYTPDSAAKVWNTRR